MLTACILILSPTGEPIRCVPPSEIVAMADAREDQWDRLLKAVRDAKKELK